MVDPALDTGEVVLFRPTWGDALTSAVATPHGPEAAKARGAFYTPRSLAGFLTRWAIRTVDDRALEPSCGDGVFIETAVARYAELGLTRLDGQLVGIELDPSEAAKCRELSPDAQILNADFFDVMPSELRSVDAVIGNPPYIRYHGFNGEQRSRGLARAKEQGLVLSNLASSWAHFVAHSASFLRPGGRLALVLPAELLHTDYAGPIRNWLLARFPSVVVVTFDKMAFEEAEVDALLLLASHDEPGGLRMVRVGSADALETFALLPVGTTDSGVTPLRWTSRVNRDAGDLYAELVTSSTVRRLGAFASVDIGVVTGANRFFILEPAEAARLRLPTSQLLPIVENPSAVKGLTAPQSSTKSLLMINREPTSISLRRYLAEGEKAGIAKGYKCRTRSPWFRVPLPKVKPHAFMPYMNHHGPRLIVNRLRAWSTNLLHGVTLQPGAPDVRALSAVMLSATTMLSAEIEGRAYGGGVLKLETREAERLLVPTMNAATETQLANAFRRLDRLVRAGEVEEASTEVDGILGLDHERFRQAYMIFRQQRLQRKNGNHTLSP
jgi:adenine-specific DNA-methyltransferase